MSDLQTTKIELQGFPNEFAFTDIPDPLDKANSLLHVFAVNPQFSVNREAMQLLGVLMAEGVPLAQANESSKAALQTSSRDNSVIEFVNPFPEAVAVDEFKLMRSIVKLFEPLRWNNEFPNAILELVMRQLNDSKCTLLSCTLPDHFSQRFPVFSSPDSSNRDLQE